MKNNILLKDTDFVKDMQISVTYLKAIGKAQPYIISLKSAIDYIQANINLYSQTK